MKNVKEDKKGRYIEIVDRDGKKLDKYYLKNDVEEKVLDSKKINDYVDRLKSEERLGYWRWRGEYNVKGKREWKSNKGDGKIYRIEGDKILYFDDNDVVWENKDEKVLDRSVWRFRVNKKNVGGSVGLKWVRKYGWIIIILFLLFRLLSRIF